MLYENQRRAVSAETKELVLSSTDDRHGDIISFYIKFTCINYLLINPYACHTSILYRYNIFKVLFVFFFFL